MNIIVKKGFKNLNLFLSFFLIEQKVHFWPRCESGWLGRFLSVILYCV